MISLLTLTNSFVYKFLKKQVNKGNKVLTSEGVTNDFDWAEAIKGVTISKQVIELRSRFLLAIGEGEKSMENGVLGNEGVKGVTQKTNFENLREFIEKNKDENGKLPSVASTKEALNLSDKQIRLLKEKLFATGFLIKESETSTEYKYNFGGSK